MDTAASTSLLEILREEIPGLLHANMSEPFDRLAIDSFGLVSLRARLERFAGHEISDELWISARTPADLLSIFAVKANSGRFTHSEGRETRAFKINMPQMAMGGLSECWLFKELGDMHWQMIANGLRCLSSELLDGSGNRLYATITRMALSLAPLSTYRENSALLLDGAISRLGAGMFFSDIEISPGGNARIMSSFSMRGTDGSNTSLLRGQPHIPQHCEIPELARLPEFGEEYRVRRSVPTPAALFTHEYEIVPQHDINGVGLLYFAAYPIISDICLARIVDQRHLSTVQRDVSYFGNCNQDETLVFRLHQQTERHDSVEFETSISRKSDGSRIAHLITAKVPA